MKRDPRVPRCFHCGRPARRVRDPAEPSVCCADARCIAKEQRYQRQLASRRQVELVADRRLT